MQARVAMILWQPVVSETGGLGRWGTPRPETKPVVRVVEESEADKYDYLPCSLGCCLHDWQEAEDRRPHIFRAFLSVLQDGLQPAEIHREFLKIDEYAEMIGGQEYFGVEFPDPEVA
jgi:hypothetical protein